MTRNQLKKLSTTIVTFYDNETFFGEAFFLPAVGQFY